MICADAVDAATTLAATVMIVAASERTPRLLVNTDLLHIFELLARITRGLLNTDLVQGVVRAYQQAVSRTLRGQGLPRESQDHENTKDENTKREPPFFFVLRVFVF